MTEIRSREEHARLNDDRNSLMHEGERVMRGCAALMHDAQPVTGECAAVIVDSPAINRQQKSRIAPLEPREPIAETKKPARGGLLVGRAMSAPLPTLD